MEPLVELLHFNSEAKYDFTYLLLIWLSQVVLVPFDIETIDSKKSQEILVKRIINICREQLYQAGKTRDASAFLLARLLNRPDVIKSGETELFLQWLALEYKSICNDGTKMLQI